MNQLTTIIKDNGLDETKSQNILSSFTNFLEQAKGWEEKAKTIVITDVLQVKEMKQAREARLALKEIRCNAEATRKTLKEQSLREGKAIDGIANIIKAVIVPIEEHLENQENFVKRKVEAEKDRVRDERMVKLSPFVSDISIYNLRDMSEEGFAKLLETSELALKATKEAERRAEEERIAKEKADSEERARIKAENDKLREEARAREEEIAKERAEKAKIENELKAKREAEKKEQERIEAEKRAEAERLEKSKLAPDKDKILIWIGKIAEVGAPQCSSERTQALVNQARKDIDNALGILVKTIKLISE